MKVQAAFKDSLSKGLTELATNTLYPGAIGALAVLGSLLPFSWPTIIIWTTLLMHFAIGLALALIAYRLHGIIAAITTIIFWIATFTVMRPILNGWMAFWWSLLPIIITLDKVLQKKYRQAIGWLIATCFIHPLSGIMLIITLAMQTPSLLTNLPQREKRIISGLVIIFCLIALYWLVDHKFTFLLLEPAVPVYTLEHLFVSPLAPATIFAPLGLFWLARKSLTKSEYNFLIAFMLLALLTVFNNLWLGESIMEWRFEPYFLLMLCLFGGIGVSIVASKITPRKLVQYIITIILTASIAISAWNFNKSFFAKYDGKNALVLLTGEQESINWIKKQTPPDAHIFTVKYSLIYKWIPILTNRRWTGLLTNTAIYENITNGSTESLSAAMQNEQITHLVIWKERLEKDDRFAEKLEDFPTVYQNDSAIIKSINQN